MNRLLLLFFWTFLLFGWSACQQESVPDHLVPFEGMVRLQNDTLFFADCTSRNAQWIAEGAAESQLRKAYKNAPHDANGFLYVYLQGVMTDVATAKENTVKRALKIYQIDSVQENYTCLAVNAYDAGGKYVLKNGSLPLGHSTTLILGFNGRAQMTTIDQQTTIREPGQWRALDSSQIQLVLNEKDTLIGSLNWQRNMYLAAERYTEAVYLVRQK